jgi:hypothetical protein
VKHGETIVRLRNLFERALPGLRLWLSPKSNRPLVLLFLVALGLFLLPLAFDVAKAIYFGIPYWLRWLMGEAALLLLIALGLKRLWRVGPTDLWPAPDEPASGQGTTAARLIPWALRLAVASLALPIMEHPDGLGFADWDFVLDKFEALRRSILIWGQFPWWNPWCRGGFPLAAEPQIGAVSLATPLVLALGTSIGLRIAAVLCLMIAVEGAYRLGLLWLREPWSSAVVALLYCLNGGVIINTAQGYVLAMSYCSVPWLAYHAFRIDRGFSDGLWLGFWLAFSVLNGIQYLTFFGGMFAALVWLRVLRLQPPGGRARLWGHTLASLGAFLALCGWRLAPVLFVLLDDKRERVTYWDESIFVMCKHLLTRPDPDWATALPGRYHATYVEMASYVGPIAAVLAAASLAQGWRWWHTLTALCYWLALGSVSWYHPSFWLAPWPIFASAHVVTRWHHLGLLGFGLAAGSVLARWRNSGSRATRVLAALCVVVIAVDLVSLAFQQFPLAFSIPREERFFPGPRVPDIQNVRAGLGFPCAQRGYGVIQGYEPMISYYRDAQTLRKGREEPDYRGESWTASGVIQPVFWSPNRIVFQAAPAQEVYLNQNPGSWWWSNGERAFPGLHCAEPMVPFVARADARGRLELKIVPRGWDLGVGLTILGVAILLSLWIGRGLVQLSYSEHTQGVSWRFLHFARNGHGSDGPRQGPGN